MPLPLTISCSSKSRLVLPFLVLPFWYLPTRVVPDIFQQSSKMVVCCVCNMWKVGICTSLLGRQDHNIKAGKPCQKWQGWASLHIGTRSIITSSQCITTVVKKSTKCYSYYTQSHLKCDSIVQKSPALVVVLLPSLVLAFSSPVSAAAAVVFVEFCPSFHLYDLATLQTS